MNKTAGCIVVAFVMAGLCASGQATPEKAAAQAEPASPYAGSETCQGCHEDIFKAFQSNRHHLLEADKRRGWEGRACEACHGPAAKHTDTNAQEDIAQPAKLAARAADRICLKCHANQPTNVGRVQGGHGRNEVSCVSCHSIHKTQTLAGTQLCAQCHPATLAQFMKPFTHRVKEGAMTCVDCHNPHGSQRTPSMQMTNANEPGCFKCHGDKRGPFTFEHAPVKTDGCAACHEPHGSANPRMLTRHEERFVCLECHANVGAASAKTGTVGGVPPAFHDLRSPRYRNCSVCHVKVHGSNVDRTLTR